ncbi:MAG: LysR family transcriptional regulator [Opitutaceae bacterium]|jgi:LysR family transcriptional regulator, regulator for metE and metH|nr:LysR family transcriptional regulator [Opitutaceae bacterium]
MNSIQHKARSFDAYSGLEMRDFRLVWAVAEMRGLTAAAKRLRLTPSALSHQLKALESGVGAPLFSRETRAMRPTAAGEVMLEAAAKVLNVIGDTEQRLDAITSGSAGTIRMCTQCYTGYHWLPEVIENFRKGYPEVEVNLVAEATNRWEEALVNREVDVVLTTERPQGGRKLTLAPTLKDEMMLLMHPDNPLAKKRVVQPADIVRENLLIYAKRPEDSLLCREVLKPAGVWPERFTNVSLTEAVFALIRANMGVACLANWAIVPQVERGELVARRIGRGGWKRVWWAATWPDREAGPLVCAFVKNLQQTLRKAHV